MSIEQLVLTNASGTIANILRTEYQVLHFLLIHLIDYNDTYPQNCRHASSS